MLALGIATAVVSIHGQAQGGAPPVYQPAYRVAGAIRVCGSPQMAELMRIYQGGFVSRQRLVHFQDHFDSTLAAVAGVASGRAEIGLLGRELWPEEEDAFRKMRGHPPLAVKVAIGSYDVPRATFALMVFVPRDNPIDAISFDQLERVFAASDRPIHTWGELGLKGTRASRPIHIYGFAKDNDKSRIFRRLVFKHNELWSPSLIEFANGPGTPGTDAGELILRAVARDPDAIGISNVHYRTPAVKPLAISEGVGQMPSTPTRMSVAAGAYPLARAVYLVVDPDILTSTDRQSSNGAAVLEFLRYVLSREGRHAVIEEGSYLPLPPKQATNELEYLAAHFH